MTNPDTSTQNGVSERFNHTIEECTTIFLDQSGLPKSFWAEAACHAAQVLTLSPHSANAGASPAKLWPQDDSILDVSCLHPFGCAAYPLITKSHQ